MSNSSTYNATRVQDAHNIIDLAMYNYEEVSENIFYYFFIIIIMLLFILSFIYIYFQISLNFLAKECFKAEVFHFFQIWFELEQK